jgi:hypothetical protein
MTAQQYDRPAIGAVFISPRGRRFRVVRYLNEYRCIVWNETFAHEEEAWWPILVDHWKRADRTDAVRP